MEERVVPKRPREEETLEHKDASLDSYELLESSSKRHMPYNHILSLLESEEEDSTQDLSPLITALQQEITNCANDSDTLLSQHNLTNTTTTTNNNLESCSSSTTQYSSNMVEEHDDKEGVMRHLLEASDDELGIPNKEDESLDHGEDGFNFNGGDMFSSFCDGLLWDLEDEAANYYDLLQSQLFL
ncbi:hypothetical protein AAZX31_18G114800 [Glycine max]|uniref:Uncharacterized protein n=1 Tax=Glycine max TaxID=3847 RepID=A0A0R0EZD3_SOYBN|nr:uncharacterized protein LOC100798289 [Glycine max]KAG4924211.1 hypothetical protein JHK87_049751 [Glycine soja]KAG4921137.1 hypothetical protein JHK86_049950 [Glycine max]KAG4935802.1 hypothetical protein JHK85_050721 [Glycine max]KAG5091300.1 hypothetical protein JHK82_050078 [Glycine max]KAH1154232.1 hypothetical protein GYH30_049753 [Glycine max]|eukprot:XP_003551970.1 uncharacterized protein LOC100798289 [Glycine max]